MIVNQQTEIQNTPSNVNLNRSRTPLPTIRTTPNHLIPPPQNITLQRFQRLTNPVETRIDPIRPSNNFRLVTRLNSGVGRRPFFTRTTTNFRSMNQNINTLIGESGSPSDRLTRNRNLNSVDPSVDVNHPTLHDTEVNLESERVQSPLDQKDSNKDGPLNDAEVSFGSPNEPNESILINNISLHGESQDDGGIQLNTVLNDNNDGDSSEEEIRPISDTPQEQGENVDQNSNDSMNVEPIDAGYEVVNVDCGRMSIIDICPICQEELDKIEPGSSYLECTHWFHFDCIDIWYQRARRSCPQCNSNSDVIYKITSGED